MSIRQITTTLYVNANEQSFDSFVEKALLDFENRILNLFNYAKENINSANPQYKGAAQFIKESAYTPDFYQVFQEARTFIKTDEDRFPAKLGYPTYIFAINTKNINFETTLVDIPERLAWWCATANVDTDSTFNTQDISDIRDIPNWKDLFGKGEFPFFHIYTFRLGNTEYFAYEIGK